MKKINKTNLLGISGKAGDGKDLVGKIIQTLLWLNSSSTNNMMDKNKLTMPVEEFVKTDLIFTPKGWRGFCNVGIESNWKIKKFAYKVKQILSILTGIPIEDFEKEEVKNSYLGEEWNRWRPIGYFDTETIATKLFASKEDAEKYSRCNSRNKERGAIQEVITVRQAMQLVGTDLFRDKFHPDTWVNALFSNYKKLRNLCKNHNKQIKEWGLCEKEHTYPNWIITDLRFENEAQAIKDRGGVLIRVNRKFTSEEWQKKYPDIIVSDPDGWNRGSKYNFEWYKEKITLEEYKSRVFKSTCMFNTEKPFEKYFQSHSSETQLDDYKFDYVIDNNGTIEELIDKVKEVLIKENIL